MRRTSALIVGGGPAGSAAAIILARAGAMPVLVERSLGERDVVCGGFLGWDALASLERLGVDVEALGARPIHRLRLVAGRNIVESELPQAAAGLSRRRLDSTLLRLAEEAGTVLLRGRTVRGVDGRCARFDDDEEIKADALFLATGKHELRGLARPVDAASTSVGLRTALPPDPQLLRDLSGTIELHFYDEGYAGLLVQEDGAVNLCLSVSRRRMAEAGSQSALLDQLVAESPLLGSRLKGDLSGSWEAIAGVPYGWRCADGADGLFRVGDQAAVIGSVVGDGIAIALASGQSAAHCFLGGGAGAAVEYQLGFSRKARTPIALAERIRYAAERPFGRSMLLRLAGFPRLVAKAANWTRIG